MCEHWFGRECAAGPGARRRGWVLVVSAGFHRWALRAVIELGRRCICCPLIVISALVVKNGRAADRMASASRFCGASCLIAVKKLAFCRIEMTYERGKTRSDDPLRASNQPVRKPKRPPSVRRAYVFDHPSED